MSIIDPTPAPLRVLLSKREAAASCAVSVRTLERWIVSGLVPQVKIGRRVLIDPRDLMTLADRLKQTP